MNTHTPQGLEPLEPRCLLSGAPWLIAPLAETVEPQDATLLDQPPVLLDASGAVSAATDGTPAASIIGRDAAWFRFVIDEPSAVNLAATDHLGEARPLTLFAPDGAAVASNSELNQIAVAGDGSEYTPVGAVEGELVRADGGALPPGAYLVRVDRDTQDAGWPVNLAVSASTQVNSLRFRGDGLRIQGSPGADFLNLRDAGGHLELTFNGQTERLDKAEVSRVVAKLGDGDDAVNLTLGAGRDVSRYFDDARQRTKTRGVGYRLTADAVDAVNFEGQAADGDKLVLHTSGAFRSAAYDSERGTVALMPWGGTRPVTYASGYADVRVLAPPRAPLNVSFTRDDADSDRVTRRPELNLIQTVDDDFRLRLIGTGDLNIA